MAFTPCCSSIGPIPGSIPPGGTATVPVLFKSGTQSGRKCVEFALATDRPEFPEIRLSLTASLLPAWEVEPIGAETHIIPAGSTASQTFRIACRRTSSAGKVGPSEVSISGPFSCRFVDGGDERARPDGIIEATRIVEVTPTSTTEAGHRSGELRFVWPDGTAKTRPIHWEISAHVRANPSSLVVQASDSPTRAIISVTCADRPIRIIRVSGPLLGRRVDPRPGPSMAHTLELSLDASGLGLGGTSEIEIITDHPDQEKVSLRAVVLPSREEVAP